MLSSRKTASVPRRPLAIFVTLLVTSMTFLTGVLPARAEQAFVPLSGGGSTWSELAIAAWQENVVKNGMRVNYSGAGSSVGRNSYRDGTVDFAVSEIPYGLTDNGEVDAPPDRKYAYMPVVAGGTAFMYNLKINGARVTNLRLSGENVTKIFTSVITKWNDPAILADNPGLNLPERQIIPVVRSDGSGTTAQLTAWMADQYPDTWNAYCQRAGRSTPCGLTSFFPVASGTNTTALSGSAGVAGSVKAESSEGAITYVEYAYALDANFPVAKLLNRAGYYIEPTEFSVAVALLDARINDDPNSPSYLTQQLNGVYTAADPRVYPLSSYSYMIIPTAAERGFTVEKGYTLSEFAKYFLCEGQRQVPDLGYSPLPINLVQAGLEQVRRIPGVQAETIDISRCNNPTFSSDGSNTLATTAPQPAACDLKGPDQCTKGTGGDRSETQKSEQQTTNGDAPVEPGAEGTTPGGGDAPADAPAPGDAGQAAGGGASAPAAGASTPPGGAKPGPAKATASGPAKGAAPTKAGDPKNPAVAQSTTGTQALAPLNPDGSRSTSTPQAASASNGPLGSNQTSSTVSGGPVKEPVRDAVTGELEAGQEPGVNPELAGQGGGPADTGGAVNGQAAQGNATRINAFPVKMSSDSGTGFNVTLMLLAGLLLVAVVAAPPLLSRTLNSKKGA